MSLECLLKRAKEIAAMAVFSTGVAISGCAVSNNKFENLSDSALSKVASEQLNMDAPHRFFKNDLEKVLNAKNEEGNIALILLAKSDHNNNFGNDSAKQAYSEVIKRYRTFAYEIEKDEDIVKQMREVGKYGKISFLMICGHGQRTGITITEDKKLVADQIKLSIKSQLCQYDYVPIEEKIDVFIKSEELYEKSDKNSLCIDDVNAGKMKEFSDYLENGATILLNSCSLAEGGYETDNFASALANYLRLRKNCKIIASQTSFGSGEIQFKYSNEKIVDIILRDDKNTLRFYGNNQLSR